VALMWRGHVADARRINAELQLRTTRLQSQLGLTQAALGETQSTILSLRQQQQEQEQEQEQQQQQEHTPEKHSEVPAEQLCLPSETRSPDGSFLSVSAGEAAEAATRLQARARGMAERHRWRVKIASTLTLQRWVRRRRRRRRRRRLCSPGCPPPPLTPRPQPVHAGP
jgi:hypothetical protein